MKVQLVGVSFSGGNCVNYISRFGLVKGVIRTILFLLMENNYNKNNKILYIAQ